MQLVGRILWWNERDGNGVIEDHDGREFYFDVSVSLVRASSLKRNQIVTFQLNSSISDCPCACKVKLADASVRKQHKSKFDHRQLKLPELT